MEKNIRVSIVEDNAGLRESLAQLIRETPEFELMGTYATGEAAIRGILVQRPDIVLMDIQLPGMSGIDCTARLRSKVPELIILVQTIYDDPDKVFAALKAGATGYLLKSAAGETLIAAVRDAFRGGAPMSGSIARRVVESFHKETNNPQLAQLTPRESEILMHIAGGLRNKEIAEKLYISPETVRRHIQSIYTKLHVRSRTEAAVKYIEADSNP